MHIAVDIDGILTLETEGHDYTNRTPNYANIQKLRELYNQGHRITLYTARYSVDKKITEEWLRRYSVSYHNLVFKKLQYDLLIDDKATNNFNKII